mmetsp:Transcript_40763/g.101275  ORF Transcript_40763/g.101275 Transcript_40763/m.101275 type:complete len:287 (-) Transcript_40763:647-1507(-)
MHPQAEVLHRNHRRPPPATVHLAQVVQDQWRIALRRGGVDGCTLRRDGVVLAVDARLVGASLELVRLDCRRGGGGGVAGEATAELADQRGVGGRLLQHKREERKREALDEKVGEGPAELFPRVERRRREAGDLAEGLAGRLREEGLAEAVGGEEAEEAVQQRLGAVARLHDVLQHEACDDEAEAGEEVEGEDDDDADRRRAEAEGGHRGQREHGEAVVGEDEHDGADRLRRARELAPVGDEEGRHREREDEGVRERVPRPRGEPVGGGGGARDKLHLLRARLALAQ